MIRMNALFRRLKQKENPILRRCVVYFWWRIEFQLRGSVQIHMVVWCEQMPTFDSPEDVELLDQIVTCEVLDSEENHEMHDMVIRLQSQRHTHTCYEKDAHCRFAFPRSVSSATRILDEEQTARNKGKFYILKGKDSATMINSYNPQLIKIWSANIDVQSCGLALGIAYYISKYISKSEPADIARLIREAIYRNRERGGDFGRQIFVIQYAILSYCEVSACECVFRLCHLKGS